MLGIAASNQKSFPMTMRQIAAGTASRTRSIGWGILGQLPLECSPIHAEPSGSFAHVLVAIMEDSLDMLPLQSSERRHGRLRGCIPDTLQRLIDLISVYGLCQVVGCTQPDCI
jgi:hypothetical protein